MTVMSGIDSPIFDSSVGCFFAGEPSWIINRDLPCENASYETIEHLMPKIDNRAIEDLFWYD